jgi:hypothetical protein
MDSTNIGPAQSQLGPLVLTRPVRKFPCFGAEQGTKFPAPAKKFPAKLEQGICLKRPEPQRLFATETRLNQPKIVKFPADSLLSRESQRQRRVSPLTASSSSGFSTF